MIETIGHLKGAGYSAPVCIGVHAVFAGDAYEALQDAGAGAIISANSVPHPSNTIDLTTLLVEGLRGLFASNAGSNRVQEKPL
jgi:ribose-phosphate pyrophosphokinase